MPSGSMKHGVLTAHTVRGAVDFKPSDQDPSGSKGTELKFKPAEVSSETAGVRCLLLQGSERLEPGPCSNAVLWMVVSHNGCVQHRLAHLWAQKYAQLL